MADSVDLRLGDFGDESLAKRGVCGSAGWWRAKAFAFGAWRADDVAMSSHSRDSWRILG
jgi:hypothetical protein